MDAEHVEHPTLRRRSAVGWMIALLLIAIAAAGYWVWQMCRPKAAPPPPKWRLYYTVVNYTENGADDPLLFSISRDGGDIRKVPHPGGQAYDEFVGVSQDGSLVAYVDGTDIERELYVSKPDGSDAVQVGETPMGDIRSTCFSADGQCIAYARYDIVEGASSDDLYVADTDGTNIRKIASTDDDEVPLAFSADSRTLFYSRTVQHGSRQSFFAFDTTSSRTRPAMKAEIPVRPAPSMTYAVVRSKTGRTMKTMEAEGDVVEVEELVDDLYLLPSGAHKIHVAHAHELTVLGWTRE